MYMVKETYSYDKRDLLIWQKRPTYNSIPVPGPLGLSGAAAAAVTAPKGEAEEARAARAIPLVAAMLSRRAR